MLITSPQRKPIILFIHGFGSSSRCWRSLIGMLERDERITSRYELKTWDYPTKWFETNILGRIPRLEEVARALETEIDSAFYRERELTLVGHSQGGLVIQSYFAEQLTRARGSTLRPVRQAVFFATPSEGSITGISFRRLLSLFFTNPQEVTLRVLNPDVSDIRAVIRERVVGAVKDSDHTWRVPIHAFCGLQDDIVPEASARGVFDDIRPVKGTHFTIICPEDEKDVRYTEFVELLLEPGGHSHRFEVERYVTRLRIEPRVPPEQISVGGRNPRLVTSDHHAELKRTVRFASANRCKHNYAIQYTTRGNGCVVGHPSARNLASPAEKGRAEDSGTYYRFEFIPDPGEDHWLAVDIYGGFGPGNRDIHFHLGDHSYYRLLEYELDLSEYLEAGYAIAAPSLYLDREDAEHSELCAHRANRDPVPCTSQRPGVYRWTFKDIGGGIIDLAWDITAPAVR